MPAKPVMHPFDMAVLSEKRTLLTSTFTNKQNKCFILKQLEHFYLLRSILQTLPSSKSFLTIGNKSGMAFIDCCM